MLFWFCCYFELFRGKSLLSSFLSEDKISLSLVVFPIKKEKSSSHFCFSHPLSPWYQGVNSGFLQLSNVSYIPNANQVPTDTGGSHISVVHF